jgi:hypothetical protein
MSEYPSNLAEETLNVEFYTQSDVLNGQISCPFGFRLLDLFNNANLTDENSTGEFIELVDVANYITGIPYLEEPKEYIRKTSIHLIAVTDAEIGRGVGARNGLKTYPYICKLPRMVNIEMQYYSLMGTAYLRQGQTMRELLNERMQFFPLTDVTIARDGHLYGTRPFSILNKDQVISIREQQFDHTTSLHKAATTW